MIRIMHLMSSTHRIQTTHRCVSKRDVGRGGDYIDVVSSGGKKDVEAWNKIPDSQKPKKYKDYSQWALIRTNNNQSFGFSEYLKENKNK